MESKTLINDELGVKNSSDELDDLLAQYRTPFEVDSDSESVETVSEKSVEKQSNESSNVSTEWRGNPAYYQTGKKAGQIRPLAKSSDKQESKEDEATISGSLIDGALFIMLIDLVIPFLIALANNKLVPKSGLIKAEDLQMTDKQKRELQPIADQVIKKMALRADPMTVFLISITGVYGLNFLSAKLESK